jgi:hypothetical protein
MTKNKQVSSYVKLKGLYLAINDGNLQGVVKDEDANTILLQHFSWMDGRPTSLRLIPKTEVYSKNLTDFQFFDDKDEFIISMNAASKRIENKLKKDILTNQKGD